MPKITSHPPPSPHNWMKVSFDREYNWSPVKLIANLNFVMVPRIPAPPPRNYPPPANIIAGPITRFFLGVVTSIKFELCIPNESYKIFCCDWYIF